MTRGILAILGSGETAPGMTKVHRELLARRAPVEAVNLDSVYGFQENVPQMSEKLEEYFRVSLHTRLTTLHLASYARASDLERTIFKQDVRRATYVFAGPGSPSYALAQWVPLGLADDLVQVLGEGGTLCFASAAALTLGAFTAPIYEIYKVGAEPFWLAGLDLLGTFGLSCVVIPHFDNHEGANYDTRYCYLGERRLCLLEDQLPEEVATLGVDEHTALILDFAADEARVLGRANAYWRHHGEVRVLANKTTTTLAELRLPMASVPMPPPPPPAIASASDDPLVLGELVARGGEGSLEALAALIRLARTGGGLIEPAPLIEGVLRARRLARESGDFQLADELRSALLASGVVVTDGPNSSSWAEGAPRES